MEDTEKEELTNQEAVIQSPEEETVEENVEDYFNPFADISDEDKKIEEDIKEEQKEDKKEEKKTQPDVEEDVKVKLLEIEATNKATREVSKFVKDHPEFGDMSDDLVDLASKAMVRGHSKPIEFAVRNVKSPSYWIEYGKKMAKEDYQEVSQNRVGSSGLSKVEPKDIDFSKMSSEEFNEYTRKVLSNA